MKSHKLRLTLLTTLVVALVLATVFVTTVALVRRESLAEEREEVRQAFTIVAQIDKPHFDMTELAEAGPSLAARVYDAGDRLVASRGVWPARVTEPADGFRQEGEWLLFAGTSKGERVVLAADLGEIERDFAELSRVLAYLWFPLTLSVGGVSWFAAQSVFRPLTKLAENASFIEGADLSQRLYTPDEAEFGALAAVLNRMLARIEESVLRGERFAADAAHELRTPLAILRTRIETTLLRPRSGEEYVASHQALLLELERLSSIVGALLRTARSEAVEAAPRDLQAAVVDAATRWRIPFVQRELELHVKATSVMATIAEEEATIVLDNLLDNARRFAPTGSDVSVDLAEEEGAAVLRVSDHGPGVPADQVDRIFERFYRIDEDRNRGSGGAGIGLAVCHRIVSGRGGTITVETTPGGGATLVVRLPVG